MREGLPLWRGSPSELAAEDEMGQTADEEVMRYYNKKCEVGALNALSQQSAKSETCQCFQLIQINVRMVLETCMLADHYRSRSRDCRTAKK